MSKIKKFLNNYKEYKVLFIVFFICLLLLGVEAIIINSKTSNNNKKKTNESNINKELTKEQKQVMGINSNSNSNSSSDDLLEKVAENTKKKEEEKNSDLYNKYEKLTDEEKEKIDTKPSKNVVSYDEIDDIKESQEDVAEIPSRFNLGEKYKLNFEPQYYGLCWDYSAMKTIETYLQIHNMGTYNFSEAHVDYVVSDKLYGSRTLNDAGMFSDWLKYSLINEGFVETKNFGDEKKAYTEEEYSKFIDMEKKNFIVTDIVQFPSLYLKDDAFYTSLLYDKKLTDEEYIDYLNVIKKHIMTNGAIQTTINTNYLNYPNFYINSGFAYNDHGVTIVGWDDNYSKENFNYVEDTEDGFDMTNRHPKKDGAFIIVNSWSTKELYYYVSYEDPSIYYSLYGVSSVNDFSNAVKLSNYSQGVQKALKNEIGQYIVSYEGEEYIPNSILNDIYTLDLSNSELEDPDLNVLTYFKNLRSVNLSNNNLTSLRYLPKLKDLYDINISDNNITDVSVLLQFDISVLNAKNNNILDMSAFANKYLVYYLSGNKNITGYEQLSGELDLSDCNIENFSSSSRFGILDLSNNPLKSVDGDFSADALYLKNNNLTNIDFIKNINSDNLVSIYLDDNDITSIELLKELDNIKEISLSGNKNIKDLDILKDIYNENRFNLSSDVSYSDRIINTIITSLKKFDDDEDEYGYDYGREGNNSTSLFVSDCNISDISLFNDLYITDVLDLSNNNIKSVKGVSLKVKSIDLSNNPLEDDSYKELINNDLSSLSLSNCGLKDLDAFKNVDLELSVLDVSNNEIKDLSPLYGKVIESLSVANNENIKGDISKINDLYNLNISSCNIDNNTFDIQTLSSLNMLNIGNNKMFDKYSELLTEDNYLIIIVDNNGIDFTNLPDIFDLVNRISGTFIINYNLNDNVIDLKDNKIFYNLIRDDKNNFQTLKLYNGTYNKYFDKIEIDSDNDEIIFNRPYYYGGMYEVSNDELNLIVKFN